MSGSDRRQEGVQQSNRPVLGLDPSSTVIGYGILSWDLRLIDAGTITPERRTDSSWARITSMHADLWLLFESLLPGAIVVEWTKGKVNVGRHHGLGAGLAVYGCGVGAVGVAAHLWGAGHLECTVAAVYENDWTGGVPKDKRQLAIASAYPQYAEHMADDAGGDIADGIGIAEWWIKEQIASRGLFR